MTVSRRPISERTPIVGSVATSTAGLPCTIPLYGSLQRTGPIASSAAPRPRAVRQCLVKPSHLDRHFHILQRSSRRNRELGGREVQDRTNARRYNPVHYRLRRF